MSRINLFVYKENLVFSPLDRIIVAKYTLLFVLMNFDLDISIQ